MRKTLPKSTILRGYNAFHAVYENGVRFNGALIYCFVILEEQTEFQSPVLWGFSVSKKRFPRAVDRNRLRRMLRECIRLHSEELIQSIVAKKKQAIIVFNFSSIEKTKLKKLMLQDVLKDWKIILSQIIQSIV